MAPGKPTLQRQGWLSMRLMTAMGLMGLMLIFGCAARVTPPKVEIETGAPVQVEVKGSDASSGFCPPGQRKKGNC
jgi:hypothetical protein